MSRYYAEYTARFERGELVYDPTKLKTCNKCGETKTHSEYRRTKNSLTGVQGPCNPCRGARERELYQENLEDGRKASRDSMTRRRARIKEQTQNPYGQEQCSYCAELADVKDHVKPLAGGGSDHENNKVPACRRCNAEKGDTDLLQFLLQRNAVAVA